jgi:sugar-specific transcriptional regulator TrmB
MVVQQLLQKFGFSDKEIRVYLALLKHGPLPVRKIAAATDINRGTTYDILKSLKEQGLVSYYHQATHQYFVAEDPERLNDLLTEKQRVLENARQELQATIPELRSMREVGGGKPVVKFYEGANGIRTILLDVLDTMEQASIKEYCVYSSADIRKYLYEKFPDFTEHRIKRKIAVKIIALGEGGQELGMDERRWLTQKGGAPTYIIIYHNKTALISVTEDKTPLGIIIEDAGLAQTQKFLFENQWQTLSGNKA